MPTGHASIGRAETARFGPEGAHPRTDGAELMPDFKPKKIHPKPERARCRFGSALGLGRINLMAMLEHFRSERVRFGFEEPH